MLTEQRIATLVAAYEVALLDVIGATTALADVRQSTAAYKATFLEDVELTAKTVKEREAEAEGKLLQDEPYLQLLAAEKRAQNLLERNRAKVKVAEVEVSLWKALAYQRTELPQ